MCGLDLPTDKRLIVGSDSYEDAGVYQLNETTALIQTLDFFTPIVDDPFSFGQVAAANAISDVYAMGGKPLLCMNIMGCPVGEMADEVFREIVEGGLDKIKEAGALLVGGHTIEDKELKYGLSVTGIVHPEQIFLNSGARPGDVLMLTKPLGTGILSTAVKGEIAGEGTEKQIVEVMAFLNKQPIDVMTENIRSGVHAVTDITGFGLLGHLHETAVASGVSLVIDSSSLPIMPGVIEFANMGIVPEGAYTNRKFYHKWIDSSLPEMDSLEIAGYDPQTSGGLLFSLSEKSAEKLQRALKEVDYPFECPVIGRVVSKDNPGRIILR